MHDWVRQAVAVARELPGVPVKLLWSREEDMVQGRYHPITQCKLRAGIDAQGQLNALHMRISGQSILAGVFPQNIRDGRDPVAERPSKKESCRAVASHCCDVLLPWMNFH